MDRSLNSIPLWQEFPSGMCYRTVCQQVFVANWNIAAGNSICASFVFILHVKNGRGYSIVQFVHNIGAYHTDIFLGWVIEALSGSMVADLILPPPLPETELLSLSSSNPLQVLGSTLSSKGSSSSLVPTLPSLTTVQSCPGTKFAIRTLGRTYHIEHIMYHLMWSIDAQWHGWPHYYCGIRSKDSV